MDDMHKIIVESFLNSCSVLVTEDLGAHEFNFCLDVIRNALLYFQEKRLEDKK